METLQKYKYGFFNEDSLEGFHFKYGRLGLKIGRDINGNLFGRFFFEKDTTNGNGIEETGDGYGYGDGKG